MSDNLLPEPLVGKLFPEEQEISPERLTKIEAFLIKKGLTQEQVDIAVGNDTAKKPEFKLVPGYLWANLKEKHKDKKMKEKTKEEKEKEEKESNKVDGTNAVPGPEPRVIKVK